MREHRIAMVAACPFPAPRGTPARIACLAEALASTGHEVHVITYHLGDPNPGQSYSIHRIPHIPTYAKYSPGPSFQKLVLLDPLLTIKVTSFLRGHEVDIIHAHHVEGVLAAWLPRRLFGIPLIFDVHTLLQSELPTYKLGLPRKAKRALGQALDRRVPRIADHIVSVSSEIRDKLTREWRIDPGRISVIPNGVRSELFHPPSSPEAAGGEPSRTLVFAGTLAPYQRIDLMLRAFARARQIRPDVRLKVLSTDDFTPYEGLARELGVEDAIQVRSCGFSELPSELEGAAAGLSPRTECDGLPQKILNYMAAGLPVVASEGSAKHLVHRRHGLVVPNDDEVALSEAILEILADPATGKGYGKNGRDFVDREMSWGRAARDLEDVYRMVLERS
jgi:glycosyltransferase involved in cell wall biosynthesis